MDGRIEVLGAVRIDAAGTVTTPRGAIGRSVAALLAAEVDQVVSLDQLVAAVWGDSPPPKAVGAVRSAISRLRSSLPSGAISSHGSGAGYSLNGQVVAVDLHEFESAVAATGAWKERAGEGSDLTVVESALVLWRGLPFADVSDTPAFAAYRDRARRAHAVLVHRHRTLLVHNGEAERALDLLHADIADDPLDEPIRIVQIDAFLALGRDDEARRSAADYRALLSDSTGLDPSPTFVALERRLRGQAGVEGTDPVGAGVQVVGRDDDVETVVSDLETPGLVTVVGLGGVGKTTLLVECLRRLGRSSRTVSLGQVDPAADLAAAIGAGLGSQGVGDDAAEVVLQRLEATRSVLALDECEHVLVAARRLLTDILSRFPELTVVATSRVPIGVPGERVVRLEPLDVGPAGAGSPATELFRVRAEHAGVMIPTDDATAATVHAICAAVDGLPLAIELAAARAASIGLDELRDRLPQDLAVLRLGRRRDRVGRSTIDDVIEWSFRSLSDDSLRLLRRLAIFPSGFSLAAVEAVSGRRDTPAPLGQLLAHSVVIRENADGAHRLRLLAPVRAAVRRKIDEAEWTALRDAHARWTLTLGEEVADLWRAGEARASVELVLRHRADFESAARRLAQRAEVVALEHLAARITPLLTGYRDLALMDLLAEVCTRTTSAGEAAWAHLVLARRPAIDSGDFAERTLAHARRAAELAEREPVGFRAEIPWAYCLLVLGRLDEAVEQIDTWLRRPDLVPREAAQLVAIQAIALVSLGRLDDARAELAGRRDVVDSVTSGGLVHLARSYAAAGNAELAIEHCRAAIDEADADLAPVLRLLHDGELLSRLVSEGRLVDAAALARDLVPSQLEAGLRQVAWTTMRVVAKLLLDAGKIVDAATIAVAASKGASKTPLERHLELQDEVMSSAVDQLGADRFELIRLAANPNLARLWEDVGHAVTSVVDDGTHEVAV